MIETLTEPLMQFGAIGAVLLYFIFKDYKITPKIIQTQNEISATLLKISILIDERLTK